MCCTRLAENTGPKNRHFGTIRQHCRAVSSQLRHAWTIGKKLVKHTSSTCPHNMVNFGLLMAEIRWRVWGTPANFNGFLVLAALLLGTLVVVVSQALCVCGTRAACGGPGGLPLGSATHFHSVAVATQPVHGLQICPIN